MTEQELEDYFLKQLENGDCHLTVGKGVAKYSMKRGSFKTRNRNHDVHNLTFHYKEGNRYLFGDGKVQAEIILDRDPWVKFHFHVDPGFNRFKLSFKTFEEEHIYGCGEQYTAVDLKGKDVPIWVSEHQKVALILKKLLLWKFFGENPDRMSPFKQQQTYCAVPSFISSRHYGFYCHEDNYGVMRFQKDRVVIEFREIPQSISLLTGNSIQEVASKMCELVGIQPKLPDWVNDGLILAVQGGADVVRQKVKEAKEKGLKIAAIWSQDWSGNVVTSFGYQVYWNWEKSDSLYPDLPGLIKELNEQGIRFLGYINPYLKEEAPLYLVAKKRGFLVRRKNGEPYHIKSTTFNAGIVDLTNPLAYNWYKGIIKEDMIGIGLSGWMADFGEYLPTDAVVYGNVADKLHNRWPSLWAKCCYEAVKECGKEDEIFYFNRAAYGHTIRYTSSLWNGDQHVDFSDEYGFASLQPANVGLACSGVGITHSDIGGYTTVMFMKRSAELFKRWSEANIFTPVYRTHEGNRPKDNVQYDDPEVIDEFVKNTDLFVKLKPYREAVLNDYYENHIPAIRPLFFAYEDEESMVNKRQYMFGNDLIVAPCYRAKKESYEVYFPEEGYVQLFTGKAMPKGKSVVEAPLGLPLAFYKKDSKFKDLFESL